MHVAASLVYKLCMSGGCLQAALVQLQHWSQNSCYQILQLSLIQNPDKLTPSMALSNPEKDRLPLVLDVASLPTNAASMSYISDWRSNGRACQPACRHAVPPSGQHGCTSTVTRNSSGCRITAALTRCQSRPKPAPHVASCSAACPTLTSSSSRLRTAAELSKLRSISSVMLGLPNTRERRAKRKHQKFRLVQEKGRPEVRAAP